MIVNTELKKIFGSKYYNIVVNYIKLIQAVINKYDVVIFMARKAYCFYNATLEAGLIEENPNCLILSSRVVTYDGLCFPNKKVAIIEDVVVQGNSLYEIVSIEQVKRLQPDIYIAACSYAFPISFKNDKSLAISDPYVFMNEKELLELATLITNFIVCEMIPYNVDYPFYKIENVDLNKLYKDLSRYAYCSISKLLNYKQSHIEEGVIHLTGIDCSGIDKDVINNTIVKLRVYINTKKRTCVFMPIVILPDLSYNDMCKLFKNGFRNKFNSIVISSNKNHELQNMYKVLQYIIALKVANMFFKNSVFSKYLFKKNNNEGAIFPFEYFGCCELTNDLEITYLYHKNIIESSELYFALGFSYDLIFRNCNLVQEYNNEFVREYISFEDILSIINLEIANKEKCIMIASLMLDVFIDNGIVVPRLMIIKHTVKRVYKFGEVARLTIHDFVLFANMLYCYADNEKRLLGKTEVEKISVLFFKKFNNCFNVEDNESESYRICFSKFGPRISCSDKCYSVKQGDALSDKLKEHNLIIERNGKIDIPVRTSGRFNVSDGNCSIFTNGLSKIHTYFERAKIAEPKNTIFDYVNTYTRLLTLFSIGNIEKDKIISLIAEVDLLKKKKIDNFPNLRNAVISLQTIIDGVLSGVWKYFCYTSPDLLKNTCQLLVKYAGEENAIHIISNVFGLDFDGSSIQHVEFFNKLGSFLCDVAIFNYHCCKYYGIPINDDYYCEPYKKFLFSSELSQTLHSKYLKMFLQNEKGTTESIAKRIKEISILANNYVDEFEVYESTYSFSCSRFKECFVVFYNNSKEELTLSDNTLMSYRYHDLIIFPIENNERAYVLGRLCALIDDVNKKILYYSTSSNISLLATISNCYGSLFLKNLEKFTSILKGLRPITTREIFVIKNSNDFKFNETFSLVPEYEFIFTESQKILEEKLIRYSYTKRTLEARRMEVKVKNNSGTIINIENVSIRDIDRELLNLKNNCTNPEISAKIDDALDACENNKRGKLKSALKWLGENAMDLVKSVSSDLIINLITSDFTG